MAALGILDLDDTSTDELRVICRSETAARALIESFAHALGELQAGRRPATVSIPVSRHLAGPIGDGPAYEAESEDGS